MNAMQPAQQEQDSFIPMDYMSMLAGIPSMSFDSMGRYGISEDQRVNAMQQGFANVLGGASQSFITGNPMPAMQAGGQVGQFIDQKLDAYSNTNLKNELASLDNKIKKLQAFGLMSDLEKGQVALEGAKIDLDNKKLMTEAAAQAVSAYSPVIDTLASIAEDAIAGTGPDAEKSRKAVRDSILAQGAAALAEIRRGNVQQGATILNTLFEQYGSLDENIVKTKIAAVSNAEVLKIQSIPERIKALESVASALGPEYKIEFKGAEPYILSPYENQLRILETRKSNAQIDLLGAQASYYRNRDTDNVSDRQFDTAVRTAFQEIQKALAMKELVSGSNKIMLPKDKEMLNTALATLAKYGLTDQKKIDAWINPPKIPDGIDPDMARMLWLRRNMQALYGNLTNPNTPTGSSDPFRP